MEESCPEDIQVMLVGSKLDLKETREVSYEMAS